MKVLNLVLLVVMVQSCEVPSTVNLSKEKDLSIVKRSELMYSKGDSLYFNFKYDSAIELYNKARILSLQSPDLGLTSRITNDIGLSYKKLGNYDSALKYYGMAAQIDLDRGDSTSLVGRWRNIGIVQKNQGNYSEAIEILNRGLDLAQSIKNLSHQASILNSVGGIYLQQERYRSAIGYYDKAYLAYKRLSEKKRESYALNNLGTCYEGLRMFDSALTYYRASLVLKRKVDTASLASTLYNIASVHGELFNYDSSFYYLSKSYELQEQIGDPRGKARSANALSDYYLEVNQPSRALEYLDEAFKYATKHNNVPMLEENYYHRANYYKATGNLELAFSYLDKWSKMRDEVFNAEKLKTLELQSTFDLQQSENEKEIAQQAASLANVSARQNLIISVVLLLFLFLVSGFSLIFYKQRRRLIGLNQELNSKNEKISMLNQQNFHFTKNSLAGIVSMLNSQTSRLQEGQVKNTLTAEKLRMETVNLLYRQLFVSGDSGKIEISSYLTQAIENTIDSILGPDVQVHKKLDISNIDLSNEIALNLGMVVNEMCLNACKYGFVSNDKILTLSLKEENGEIILHFADNGNGFPSGFDWNTTTSFGIQLIKLLASDMDAEIHVDNSDGLSYQLKIPQTS